MLLLAAALLLLGSPTYGKPRQPLPAIPEMGVAACLGYNGGTGPASGPAPLLSIGVRTVESWSGHALLQIPANEPALLALPATTADGKTNLPTAAGTIRLWYAPVDWSSTGAGGNGPGTEAVLWTVGAWSDQAAVSWYSLSINAAGTAIIFRAHGASQSIEIISSSIEFCAGDWHQLALAWSEKESVLFIDGEPVAKGPGGALVPLTKFEGTPGFCIGSGVYGTQSACGMIEETIIFSRVCNEAELKGDWQRTAPVAARGPITPEEEAQWLKMAEAARAARALAPTATPASSGHESQLLMMGDCASELAITRGQGTITLTITSPALGKVYDLFRTFHLQGDSIVAAHWQKVGSGVNGNTFTFPNQPCSPGFYVLGCDLDTDEDGLTDAFEMLVNKTSPSDTDTDNDGFTDDEEVNVLVNAPEQDCGTEQNTQSETTLVAFENTVIAAWVDSNLGVAGYGFPNFGCAGPCSPPSGPIRFIGWAVSRDGGQTFTDKGSVPLLQPGNKSDAGDPVLARDNVSETIYLVSNPQRPGIYYPDGPSNPARLYVPLWRSTDDGESFSAPINATPGLAPVDPDNDYADKPALVVDNFAGVGQGKVYLVFALRRGAPDYNGKVLVYRSEPGGLNWQKSNPELGVAFGNSHETPALAVAANHDVYVIWREGNKFYLSKSTDGGANFSVPAGPFLTANSPVANLKLTRSNFTDLANDFFRTPVLPTLLADPVLSARLYMVYTDRSPDGLDRANIYFIQSSDGGTSWGTPIKVNADSTINDQWQASMTIKPDGTKLFIAWYDRRNDLPANSLIQTYGVIATLPITGLSSFAANFAISTVQFPPAFTGTNQIAGTFDPVYPPLLGVNDPRCCESHGGIHAPHMGDYDTAVSDNTFIYYSWGDNRLRAVGTFQLRNQADVRFVKFPWVP